MRRVDCCAENRSVVTETNPFSALIGLRVLSASAGEVLPGSFFRSDSGRQHTTEALSIHGVAGEYVLELTGLQMSADDFREDVTEVGS